MNEINFSSDIFGIPYDDLPSTNDDGPDILKHVFNYFESYQRDFFIHFSNSYGLFPDSVPIVNSSPRLSDTYVKLVKLLCELPEPFIPRDLIKLYSISPSLTSAQQVVANLPLNKRTLFNQFVSLLREIAKNSIFPIEFDRVLGVAFAHQYTFNFFDYLTKQNCSSLCFPFSHLKSFLPEEQPNSYPEVDFEIDEPIDYTCINVDIPPEMLIAPSQTIAEQLARLYNSTKMQAKSFGLTDEILNNVDNISIQEAEKYRSELKSLLLQFEHQIAALINRKPLNSDKTPLASLYRIHMKLRNRCRIQSKRDELLIEKKKLQRELNDFRTEFEGKYGRKIASAADKAPVAVKYQRYKAIKEELAKLENRQPQ